MGAKTWMLVYADGDAREALRARPALDREASLKLAAALFPGEVLKPQARKGDLSATNPPDDELVIGCFPGLAIVASIECAQDCPSKLPARFLAARPSRHVYLHAMHSVVDWFAYAHWQEGRLVRSLSVSPDNGEIENIGTPMPFEEPYWRGEHPAVEPDEDPSSYPLPFHPLELGEAALRSLLGYQLEGWVDPSLLEPESIPLMRLTRVKPWWKFWR